MKYRPQLRSCSKPGKWIELAGHWQRWMIIPFYARIKSDIDILPAVTYQYSDEYKQKTATSTCACCLMLESRVSKLWPACQTGLRNHFVKSEKNKFIWKIFWFGRMQHIPKQSCYVRCLALEMLCNSLRDPLENVWRPCCKATMCIQLLICL